MKSKVVWALVGLNLLLAVGAVMRFTRPAAAFGQVTRRPGPADYIMIPGEVPGGSTEVIYVIDTTNGVLSAMAFNDSRGTIDPMAPIDLNRVFSSVGTAGGGRGASLSWPVTVVATPNAK